MTGTIRVPVIRGDRLMFFLELIRCFRHLSTDKKNGFKTSLNVSAVQEFFSRRFNIDIYSPHVSVCYVMLESLLLPFLTDNCHIFMNSIVNIQSVFDFLEEYIELDEEEENFFVNLLTMVATDQVQPCQLRH